MKPQYYMDCYPWDLEEQGCDGPLACLAGEVGVEALSVAVVLPEITQLRTLDKSAGRVFRSRAAAHFQPATACYTRGNIRPIAAAWMKSRNPLEKIVTAASRHRVGVRAFIQPIEGESLVERFPHAARLNYLGENVVPALCPSHPDVREYLAALVDDLSSNYELDAIEIAGLHYGRPVETPHDPYRILGDAAAPARSAFCEICFCSACRQRAVDAAVDVQYVEQIVRRIVDQSILTVDAATMQRTSDDHSVLDAYRHLQSENLTALMKSVRAKCKSRLYYRLPPGECTASEILPPCDAFVVESPRDASAPSVMARHLLARGDRVDLRIDILSSTVQDGAALVAATHEAVRAGYHAIGFASYGVVPRPCLEWVRQAVRYARRES